MMKVFLFDIGNVLCDFTYERFLIKYEEISGKRINMHLEEDEKLYHAVEEGKISDSIYVDRMNELKKTSWKVEDLVNAWQHIFLTNSFGQSLYYHAIGQSTPVYTLSNIAAYHITAINLKWSKLLSSADGLFLSYKMGVRKPDIRIYDLVINKLKVLPENCFFIDDLEENIIAAKSAGMNAYQFIPQNYEEIKATAAKFFEWKN